MHCRAQCSAILPQNGGALCSTMQSLTVNPLSVAKGKKLRLVIDLRRVNNFLVRFKFKYEDLRSLSHVLACFCFTKLLRPLVKRSRSMSHSSFFHLAIDLVRHLNSCSGRRTPIIPEWPSASFWPFLSERSCQFKSFVVDVFILPAITDLLLEAPGQRQIYASWLLFFEVARSSECWLCA